MNRRNREAREKWFVSYARVLAWMLGSFYALLLIGQAGLVIREGRAMIARGEIKSSVVMDALVFGALGMVVEFLCLGLPTLILFEFVRCRTKGTKSPVPPSQGLNF